MSRSEAYRRLSQKTVDAEYREAGILVNLDGRVPLDEAAPCYKSSREVVQAVLDAGLAEIEHELWPLSSLKGTDDRAGQRKKSKQQDEKRERRSQRRQESDWQRFLVDAEADSVADADATSDAGNDGPDDRGDPEPDPSSHHY
jgi:hypothetical protein